MCLRSSSSIIDNSSIVALVHHAQHVIFVCSNKCVHACRSHKFSLDVQMFVHEQNCRTPAKILKY